MMLPNHDGSVFVYSYIMRNALQSCASGFGRAARPRQVVALVSLLLAMLSVAVGELQPDSASGQPKAVPAFRQADRVAIITIHGPIDRVTSYSVRRRMDIAIKGGAQAIVFDIDTPGGEVPAVLDICSMIKSSTVPNTVAWIHPKAFSGGAIIALACREIVVADGAQMGDALPIMIGPGGVDVATQGELRKKQVPPVLAEVVDSARIRGWDEFIVQAIVIDRVELWWVEQTNPPPGTKPKRMAINESEFRLLFPGQDPPRGLPGITGAHAERQASAPASSESDSPPSPDSGATTFKPASPALRDLSPALSGEVSASSVPDLDMLSAPSKRPQLTEADAGQWRLVGYLTNGSGPIVMSQQDLIDYGFASAVINTDEELRAYFGASNVVRITPSWSEAAVKLLSNMWVRMGLIVVFLLAMFIEMSTPGVILPGTIAGIALVLILAPAWMLGLAGWWEAVAIVLGIVLILVEILVIPGFGIFGIAGVTLLFGGLVWSFVGYSGGLFPDSPSGQQDLMRSAVTVLLALATAVGGMVGVSKYLGTLPFVGRLVLQDPTSDDGEGLLEAMDEPDDLAALVGRDAVAHSPLRPSGRIELDGQLYDAMSAFGIIDSGTRVRVVRAESWQVVVEPTESSGSA
ncbi:MAG TPA: hypothetical protein ENJ00_02670 [Phycisphaerales bacterium]|nr:hypothetical protein [Phycisphaerales bacterium]